MKFQTLNLWRTALFALLLTAWSACAQNIPERIENVSFDKETQRFLNDMLGGIPKRIEKIQSITLDNELQPSEEGRDANFYSNPLLLGGKPLEYADFSIASKGILALVEGNPESPEATKVPFRIYLRRDGVAITQGKSDCNREVTAIEIADVLALAKHGDHLLIVPARKTDWKAKRIIKVIDGC